ncbi:MAG: hypothetical protein IJR66_00660 [Clostridia bacterium]|nr:hypothetical protein [Clostridia bacterium]
MIKIVITAILFAGIIMYLKSINSELAILTTVIASLMLISKIIFYLEDTISFINRLFESANIDSGIIEVILKITGIGFTVEFASDILEDFGLKSLSNKLVILGKLIILSVAFPVIYSFYNVILSLL